MDHPNIAKVLEAGATETGRPFFVMELVRGIKITDYCNQEGLSTTQRLQLFVQVCRAVQHAHQKGIIHRDLKPSNILVTLHDGVPLPKVIDFGIAKATTDQRLTDKTVKVWDPATGREVLDLRGHEVGCHCVAVSPGGKRLVSAGGDGTIRIWDATHPEEKEGTELLTLVHDSEVWSTEFSPNGQYLASGVWTGSVQLRDARSGALLRAFAQPGDIISTFRVAFSPDSERLAAAAISRDRTAVVKVWETATGREVCQEIREKSVGFFVAFDPTGKYLIREGPEHTIQVRDAQTGALAGVLGRHSRQIWGGAFSSDGRRVATASNDGTVRVWAWPRRNLSGRPLGSRDGAYRLSRCLKSICSTFSRLN